eukprot:scaffold43634_cov64-Phaeocystis_antarctica.AAC.9
MPRVLAVTDTSPGGPGEKPSPVDVAERLRRQTANDTLWCWIRFPSSTCVSFCLAISSAFFVVCFR